LYAAYRVLKLLFLFVSIFNYVNQIPSISECFFFSELCNFLVTCCLFSSMMVSLLQFFHLILVINCYCENKDSEVNNSISFSNKLVSGEHLIRCCVLFFRCTILRLKSVFKTFRYIICERTLITYSRLTKEHFDDVEERLDMKN
jgi:hypothetical protein